MHMVREESWCLVGNILSANEMRLPFNRADDGREGKLSKCEPVA